MEDGETSREVPQPGNYDEHPVQAEPGGKKEKKEEAPRAGTSRPAGPGPETKVTNQSNIEPTLTDDENLHLHGQTGFNDDPGNNSNLADGETTTMMPTLTRMRTGNQTTVGELE